MGAEASAEQLRVALTAAPTRGQSTALLALMQAALLRLSVGTGRAGRTAPQAVERAAVEITDALAGRPVRASTARMVGAAMGLVGIHHTVSP